jgi:hypothetical protein
MSESVQQPREEDFAKLASEMARLLAGHHPGVQGAALANMVVVWLGGHAPEPGEQAFEKLIKTVRATAETLAKEHAARHAY